MDYYSIFYWLTVSDSVKKFFDTSSNIFTGFASVAFIGMVVCSFAKAVQVSSNKSKNEEADKVDADIRGWEMARKFFTRFFYPLLALSLVTWFGYMATPTKKDCLLIVAGGAVGNFMQSDSSAKELPSDITKFLHISLQKEIESLGSEAKKEFGIQTPKEKLMDKAKELTKEQLIEYLQKDTTISIK